MKKSIIILQGFTLFVILAIIKYSLCDTHTNPDPKTRYQRFCNANIKYYLFIGFIGAIILFCLI